MKSVHQLLRRMRTLWMIEHFARSGLLVIALAINAGLICWLMHRLAGLPLGSLAVVAVLAIAVLIGLTVRASAKVPGTKQLAKMLDDRAGTEDLYSSALEFHDDAARFGWLGRETVTQAVNSAAAVALKPRVHVGTLRNWLGHGLVAAVLILVTLTLGWLQNRKSTTTEQVAINRTALPPVMTAATEEKPKPPETPAVETPPVVLPEPDTQPDQKPATDTVQITNAMIEKYLEQPGQDPVDLTGVTPIRWDQDEASGKNNPQDKQTEGEKIDPVKLDAALLKDLQVAKKTKDEAGGSKDGGVDIAVMANQGDLKAKGNQGGKNNKESLSDAVSKDPRGEPSRMAVKPAPKALPIRSVEKLPTREKGEDRPMSPLDFASALERMKTQPPEVVSTTAKPMTHPEDRVVRQEAVPEPAAELTESYFDLLRKADR